MMATLFTGIQPKIEKKNQASLSLYLINSKMQPSTSVKSAVMHTIYSAQAELHKKFVLVNGENVEGCNIHEE